MTDSVDAPGNEASNSVDASQSGAPPYASLDPFKVDDTVTRLVRKAPTKTAYVGTDPFGINDTVGGLFLEAKAQNADESHALAGDPFLHLREEVVLSPRFTGLESNSEDIQSRASEQGPTSLTVIEQFRASLTDNGHKFDPLLPGTDRPRQDAIPQSQDLDGRPSIDPVQTLMAMELANFAAMYNAASLLGAAYVDMRDLNFKGDDKFFHCRAHCEAVLQGYGGMLVSDIVSIGREARDLPWNVLGSKNMTWEASLSDCIEDIQANNTGGQIARQTLMYGGGVRCASQCYDIFPFKMK